MEQSFIDKLKINIAASWKMYSVIFLGLFSAAAAKFLALPDVCAAGVADCTSKADIYTMLHLPAWTWPIIAFVVTYVLRVLPQFNVTPAQALAKSADAPQPPAPGADRPAQPGADDEGTKS